MVLLMDKELILSVLEQKGVGEFRKDKPWNVTEYDKNGNISGKYVKGEWIKN